MTSNKSKKKYVPLSAFEAEAGSPTAWFTDASSTPKTPLNELLGEKFVVIYVGPKKTKFNLHENLLCDKSEYFRTAFRSSFKEAEEKTLSMPEDSVDAFEYLVNFLYAPKFTLQAPESEFMMGVYFELYILSSKLCIDTLQNAVIDTMLRFFRAYNFKSPYLRPAHVQFIYENTTPTSKMRDLVAQLTILNGISGVHGIYGGSASSAWDGLLQTNAELAFDILKIMRPWAPKATDFGEAIIGAWKYCPRTGAQPIDNQYQYMTPARTLPKMVGRVEFDPAYNTLLPVEEAEHLVNEF